MPFVDGKIINSYFSFYKTIHYDLMAMSKQ